MLSNESLKIRQQPSQARMQGVTSFKAQRLLDPPLIIELETSPERVESSTFICTISLLSNSLPADIFLSEDNVLMSNLLGARCQSAVLLYDDTVTDTKKLFFIMPNLSIRLPGEYQLACNILNLQK